MCTVAAASGAASVRVWHITSRGWGPWTERPLPEGVRVAYPLASNALAAGEAPSWVAAMLGHASPEMLFSVYARYIPNRTRRDGSALMHRMEGTEPVTKSATEAAAVLPKYSR